MVLSRMTAVLLKPADAHDISPTLDANGNTSVNVKLTSKIGDNNIAMDAYRKYPEPTRMDRCRGEWYTIFDDSGLFTFGISPDASRRRGELFHDNL